MVSDSFKFVESHTETVYQPKHNSGTCELLNKEVIKEFIIKQDLN